MRVSSPISLDVLRHFRGKRGDGATHVRKERDGGATVFRLEACDRCGASCVGPNAVHFTAQAVGRFVGLFLVAGFEPTTATDELGCNDDGDAVCPACYANDSDSTEDSAADRKTRWEEQGRPLEPATDERESRFDDDQRGGGPESD